MKKKVLICGASGFIGCNLAARLAQHDDLEVSGTFLSRDPRGTSRDHPAVQWVRADLTDRHDVARVVRGKDVVIQAAAVTSGAGQIVSRPHIHVTDNAVMNSLLFRECFEQKVGHVVFFSCTVMYPPSETPLREEDFNHQIIDKYFGAGWTKVYLEKQCEFYARLRPTRYTAIRHSNIYGPHDKYDLERSHVFGATVTKVMTNENGVLEVWGDGSEARDLLHVSDLVDFVERALARQKTPFELVNVGSGEPVSVRDLAQRIIKAAGKEIELRFDPSKPTIPINIRINIDKARKVFGWTPGIDLDDGIRRTLDWYRKEFKSTPAA